MIIPQQDAEKGFNFYIKIKNQNKVFEYQNKIFDKFASF